MLVTSCMLAAQDLPADPVMKARADRARAQGLNEADLPPVPRGVTEPPPLPPPETHRKDTPAGRLASRTRGKGRRGRGGRRATAGQPEAPRSAKAAKHPRSAPRRRAPQARKKRKA